MDETDKPGASPTRVVIKTSPGGTTPPGGGPAGYPYRAPEGGGSNLKPAVIVLIILVLMLSGGLWVRHSSAEKQHRENIANINALSNQLVQATAEVSESKQVNTVLESHMTQQADAVKRLSNSLNQAAALLSRTETDAKKAADVAAKELADRDKRIGELEGQRDDLTKRMTELNGQIGGLEGQIEETQRKLAASEGDRAFLLKELKRMQQEKIELERQFNDLAMLRDQVKKLKDELSISSRLAWLRRGLYGSQPKAAEKLKPLAAGTNKFDLNVELKQDGGVKVNPAPAPAPK